MDIEKLKYMIDRQRDWSMGKKVKIVCKPEIFEEMKAQLQSDFILNTDESHPVTCFGADIEICENIATDWYVTEII